MSEYSVKGVKTFTGRDGEGFNATLYRDGKRIGLVLNEGCGGCNTYQIARDEMEALKAHAAPLYPDMKYEQEDAFVGSLIDAYLEDSKLRSMCKRAIIIRLKGDEPGVYRSFGFPFTEANAKKLDGVYGDRLEEIINRRYAG